MFAKRLQWRDGADLAVDVDDEHAGGGVEPSGGDPGGVSPPPIFSGGSLLSLCFVVSSLGAASLSKRLGDPLYSRF